MASLPAEFSLREISLGDYDELIALWKRTEGVGLNESDTRPAIAFFLERNPGLSRVATDASGRILGALLCGHDGRRGYLHHLAVAAEHRKRGIGSALVDAALADLRKLGIFKCNLFLIANNHKGREFWLHEDWKAREDLVVIQKTLF